MTVRRPGRPAEVNRENIITATRQLVDTQRSSPSMREVAAHLGVSPTAIYYHFQSKTELLVAVFDDMADELWQPTLPEDPVERIMAVTETAARGYAKYPWALSFLLAGEARATSGLWLIEDILTSASRLGLSIEQSVELLEVLWRLMLGEVSMINSARDRQSTDNPHWFSKYPVGTMDSLPRTRDALPGLQTLMHDRSLAASVRLVVEAFVARKQGPSAPPDEE